MILAKRIDNYVLARIHAIEQKFTKNPITNVYGLSRTLLASGILVTLLFNNSEYLFVETTFQAIRPDLFKSINLFFLLGFKHLFISKIIAMITLAFVISGYYPRASGILHWWVSYSFFNAAIIVDGGDQVTEILTLLYIPITLMDNRRNHWSPPKELDFWRRYLGSLIIFLIRLQIAIIYFNAAVAKFDVPEWVDGTAMYYWIVNNTFGAPGYLRPLLVSMVNIPVVVLLMTWGTIIFETLLFTSVFLRNKARMNMLKLGILFHFLIFMILGLGSFFFAMAGSLVIYLYPTERNIGS